MEEGTGRLYSRKGGRGIRKTMPEEGERLHARCLRGNVDSVKLDVSYLTCVALMSLP